MWLFSTTGFYSIVEERGKPSRVLVRGRVRSDLQSLHALMVERYPKSIAITPVIDRRPSDYPYGFGCTKKQLGAVLVDLVTAINYSNFKSAIGARQGNERERLYHEVWHAMFGAKQKLSHAAKVRRLEQVYGARHATDLIVMDDVAPSQTPEQRAELADWCEKNLPPLRR